MNFRSRSRDEPEINLIPFIDVLLVVLIFLMLTTTYSKFTELQLQLPVASADAMADRPKEIIVTVGSDGRYAVGAQRLADASVDTLAAAMVAAANGSTEPTVVVSADASATHQAVIKVLEAARRSGLTRLSFAAQAPAGTSGN
ncbi:MAG: biopolymer transporter ExbD [Burkholderiales bacterium]